MVAVLVVEGDGPVGTVGRIRNAVAEIEQVIDGFRFTGEGEIDFFDQPLG